MDVMRVKSSKTAGAKPADCLGVGGLLAVSHVSLFLGPAG